MMSDNRLIMRRNVKRKIVLDCEITSKKKNDANSITSPKISYTEESEEIQIIYESDAVNSKCLELDTSKYTNNFLKHPVLTTGRKLQKKYTRNNLKKSSLSVSDVESHFFSGIAVPDLGDIIQVKEYAPSKEEIECYHRLVVEESSPKLISRRDEQNLKKEYSHLEACIADSTVELHPSVSSPCMVSNSQVASGSNSSHGNIYFEDDSWDSNSANVSQREVIQREKLPVDSFVINSGNIQNVPLSSDNASLISDNSNSLRNATNYNLQHSASDHSSIMSDETIKAAKNYNVIQQVTENKPSGIEDNFHDASNNTDTDKSILPLNNSNSEESTVIYNLQRNLPSYPLQPDDEMQNSVINLAETLNTDEASNILSHFSANVGVNNLNEINVEKLQNVSDEIKSINNENNHTEIVSQDKSVHYYLNTVVNSCVTNESSLTLTNLSSSCRTDYLNEINISNEDLKQVLYTVEKMCGINNGCQNDIVSEGNNVPNFINADSERNVGIETIKSRFPLAAKENSDEDLESFNDDNETESLEGREEQEFAATEIMHSLTDKENNNITFYNNDKVINIEKSKSDGFVYGINNNENNSYTFNGRFRRNEELFCKNNWEEVAVTEISRKNPPSDNNSNAEIDDINLLGQENSTSKKSMETTKDIHDNETEHVNFLETEKLTESPTSKETVEDALSTEYKTAPTFYGNRVSNRGAFLVQKNSLKPHSERNVGIETIKSRFPLAAKENSDKDLESFNDDRETDRLEGREEQEIASTEIMNSLTDKEDSNITFYNNDKVLNIEKSKSDVFVYGINNNENNSFTFNRRFRRNEELFCKNNWEEVAVTEISRKNPPSDNNSNTEIDDINLLGQENSTSKESVETTKDINDKETDHVNFLETEKLTESPTSKETVEDALSTEYKTAPTFYGNRVSNRGAFLAQKNSMKPPPKPNISKKKTFKVNQNLNTNPELLHALIKTPDINIDLSRLHSSGNRHTYLDSNRNKSHESSGISPIRDSRLGLFEDRQNTPVYSGNYVRNPNISLSQAPVSTLSSALINNNMTAQGSVLSTYFPPVNFMLGENTLLNSVPVSSDPRTSEYVVNRFPSFPLTHISQAQYSFQPYMNPRIPLPIQFQSYMYSTCPTPVHPIQLQPCIDSGCPTPVYPFQLQPCIDSGCPTPVHPIQLQPCIDSGCPTPVQPPQHPFQTYVDARTQAERFDYNSDSTSEIESTSGESNIYTPITNTSRSRNVTVMLPPNLPSDTPMSISFSIENNVSSKSLQRETKASDIQQLPSRKFYPETSSDFNVSSSSAYKAPVVHTEKMSGKPKCLVPSRMKYKIGSKIFKTHDVLLLILEWNVDSIIQNKQDFPPISCIFKKVSSSYENFEEYYNTFFPLLMLETRQRVHTSLSRLNLIRRFSAKIVSYLIAKDHVIVECESVYSADLQDLPDTGSFIIVNYGTKSNEHTVKIFGYITHSYLRSFDPKTDSETCKYSEDHTDMESSTLSVLTIKFKVAYDSEHINHQSPVRLQAVYALKYSLKQHDALLSIKNSPYEKYVLKPSTEGLLRFSLNPEATEDQISKCAEDVIEKILPLHSKTLITILKTDSGTSQHLEIILLLIQMLKNNGNNMKVLVCVRARGTITDIAEKLSSQSDLKFVIMCKRGEIGPKFRKFVFDDLVSKKKQQVKDIRGERKKMKGETKNIKKEIALDCDVVILWARGIHNTFLAKTLSESKSIDNTCCIVDEAHSFTEPETFIPTLYGISRLILIGSTADKPRVLSEAAITYAYDKSYLERACDSD